MDNNASSPTRNDHQRQPQQLVSPGAKRRLLGSSLLRERLAAYDKNIATLNNKLQQQKDNKHQLSRELSSRRLSLFENLQDEDEELVQLVVTTTDDDEQPESTTPSATAGVGSPQQQRQQQIRRLELSKELSSRRLTLLEKSKQLAADTLKEEEEGEPSSRQSEQQAEKQRPQPGYISATVSQPYTSPFPRLFGGRITLPRLLS